MTLSISPSVIYPAYLILLDLIMPRVLRGTDHEAPHSSVFWVPSHLLETHQNFSIVYVWGPLTHRPPAPGFNGSLIYIFRQFSNIILNRSHKIQPQMILHISVYQNTFSNVFNWSAHTIG
jgi:hypothetical protein